MPLREPAAVDVLARLRPGVRRSDVQGLIARTVTVPTRMAPHIDLEEVDDDEVVVRITAVPVDDADGWKLAHEVLTAVEEVTRREVATEHVLGRARQPAWGGRAAPGAEGATTLRRVARSRRAARAREGIARRRAIIGMVAIALVLLLAFTAFVLRLAEEAVRAEAEERVRTTAVLTAQLAAEQSQRFAEVTDAYAQRLRTLPAPRRARLSRPALARVERTLRALRIAAGGVDATRFTDPLGRVVAADPPAVPTGSDESGADWYKGLRAGRSRYLSRADALPGAAGPATSLAVRVTSPTGAPAGILVATAVNRFQGLTDAAGKDVTLTLTDQAGTIVSRTGRPPGRLVTRARDGLVTAALAGRSGVDVRDVDGRPTVSGYAPVARTGWAVVAEVPADRAFADVTRLRITLLAGAAVIAFVLLWLVPLLALRLGRAREQVVVSERFQTDLLPADLPAGVVTHYVASEKRMLLGGDFLDAVRTPDGGLAVLVGDVCGHGPRAAALAARLRASWRTLAVAGAPLERLDVLERIVISERPDEDLFATVVVAQVDAAGKTLRWALAGHPPALLDADGVVAPLEGSGRGPALGLVGGMSWPVAQRALPERWTLVLFSDGLIEAHDGPAGERLELEGLQALVEGARGSDGISPTALVAAVAKVADAGGRGLDDDLALLVVDSTSTVRQDSHTEVHGVGHG